MSTTDERVFQDDAQLCELQYVTLWVTSLIALRQGSSFAVYVLAYCSTKQLSSGWKGRRLMRNLVATCRRLRQSCGSG